MALSTARVRSRTPSFERILETWFFTVPSEMSRASAISRLEYPPVIKRRIFDSRSVRVSSGFKSARREVGFNSRMSRTVSAGAARLCSSIRLGPWSATAVGDNCDLKVLRETYNVLGEIPATQPLQKTDLRVRHKNLRDLIASREFHHGLGDIAAAKYAGFN